MSSKSRISTSNIDLRKFNDGPQPQATSSPNSRKSNVPKKNLKKFICKNQNCLLHGYQFEAESQDDCPLKNYCHNNQIYELIKSASRSRNNSFSYQTEPLDPLTPSPEYLESKNRASSNQKSSNSNAKCAEDYTIRMPSNSSSLKRMHKSTTDLHRSTRQESKQQIQSSAKESKHYESSNRNYTVHSSSTSQQQQSSANKSASSNIASFSNVKQSTGPTNIQLSPIYSYNQSSNNTGSSNKFE
jgi:hypothetical protein